MLSASREVVLRKSAVGESGALALLLAVLILSCRLMSSAGAQDASQVWPTKGWQTSTPEEQGMDSVELAKFIDFGGYQGIDNILIARHGKIVADAYFAPFRAGATHVMYSATKSVTGSLIAIALQEGKLDDLNHKVMDFFSDRKIENLDQNKRAITVQNLLDMTSGLDWEEGYTGRIAVFDEWTRSQDWVQFVLDRPMKQAPGLTFNYDSGAAHLLSAIISKLSGEPAYLYAREHLFQPLGITDVFWSHDPQNITFGPSGLYLQPRDMAKIGYLYLRGGVWEGQRILPDGWVDKIVHASLDTNNGWATDFHYGNLFWNFQESDAYAASGYHGERILVMPKLDIVAVITGTQECYADTLISYISRSVKSDTPLPSNPVGDALLSARIKQVATEQPSPIRSLPDAAKAVSGRVYRFADNARRFKSISLHLTDANPSYEFEYSTPTGAAEKFVGAIGLDGLFRESAATKTGFIPAAKGTWIHEKAFVIKRQTLGSDDLRTWLLVFDGKRLELISSGADGPDFVANGEADE